jgi:nucleotide-binding universal stress UspA family protein
MENIVTTDTPSSGPRIVVAVDGSAPSIEALRWAAPIALATGVDLQAVISWEHPPAYPGTSGHGVPHPGATAENLLDQSVTAAFGETRPAGLRTVVREGRPEAVLLEESLDADMLVVGSRGHGTLANLLLGSVSVHCAEHARCPVVIIHDRSGSQLSR